jgi:hypothetical protein
MKKTAYLLFIYIIMGFVALPVVAQESQTNQATGITLQHYLRGLRGNGVTSFPSGSRIMGFEEVSSPFRRTIAGVSLIATGDHESQVIHQLDIAIANPRDMRQSDRWLALANASLATLVPNSSSIDRLLALQRTISQGSYTFENLTLTSSWQAAGQTITIAIG